MKTTRRDKELFESQHYNRKLARPLTFPFSRSFSAPLNGMVTTLYGMWFDYVNDYVQVPDDVVLRPESGDFEIEIEIYVTDTTPSTQVIFVDKGNADSSALEGYSIRLRPTTGYPLCRCNGSGGSSQRADVQYESAMTAGYHTIKLMLDRTTNKIRGFLDGSETGWVAGPMGDDITGFSSINDTGPLRFGVSEGGTLLGRDVIRNVTATKAGVLVGKWDGHGNTNADWEDQVGSNDGTVSGSPSRAISTDGGATWDMETASDADAAAYVTRLLNTGTSITPAQISALDTFFLTGKSEGWYSALKRMYLPIWAAAGPNAIDMIGGTSGTFVGGVTHSAGYVTGNGTTGYFRTDAKIPAVASIEDVLVGTLNKTGHQAANKIGIGSGATSAVSIRLASGSSSIRPVTYFLGVNITGSATGTAGINLAAREGGTTYLGQKLGAGSYGELSNTGSLTSALDDHFVTVMGTATTDTSAAAHSTSQIGGAVIATGMDATQRGEFVTAWEALWETTTGLTLP